MHYYYKDQQVFEQLELFYGSLHFCCLISLKTAPFDLHYIINMEFHLYRPSFWLFHLCIVMPYYCYYLEPQPYDLMLFSFPYVQLHVLNHDVQQTGPLSILIAGLVEVHSALICYWRRLDYTDFWSLMYFIDPFIVVCFQSRISVTLGCQPLMDY